MSYLTESVTELEAEVVTELADENSTFNPKTETLSQFYSRALGEPTAYLRKPVAQLVAELNSAFGGAARSHLLDGYAELLDALSDQLSGGGGNDYVVTDDGEPVTDDGEPVIDTPEGE